MFLQGTLADEYLCEFNKTLNEIPDHPTHTMRNNVVRNWQRILAPLDMASDYLCICKDEKRKKYPDGKPITCYDDYGLRRLYYDKKRPYNEANFNYIINRDKLNGKIKDFQDIEIIEFWSDENGYLKKDSNVDEIVEIKIETQELLQRFNDPIEKNIAIMLIQGYKKNEIKKLLGISQFILQQKIDSIVTTLVGKNAEVINVTTEYHTCRKCGQSKPKSDFAKDKRIKSGYKSTCKECDSKRHTKL